MILIKFNSFLKLILIFSLSFLGCRKVLDYDLFYEGDQLTINSLLIQNEPFFIELTHSVSPSEPIDGNPFIANATARFYQEDSLLFLLNHTEKGIYKAPDAWRPNPTAKYRIEIDADGYTSVATQMVEMPNPLNIQQTNFNDSTFTPGSTGDSGGEIEITFLNNLNENNFYLFTAWADWDTTRRLISLTLSDETLKSNTVCSYSSTFLTDNCFFSSSVDLAFLVSIPSTLDGERPSRIILYASEISESYYQYYQFLTQPEDIEQAFSDPLPNYSNVEGGFGFLGAINTTFVTIPLD